MLWGKTKRYLTRTAPSRQKNGSKAQSLSPLIPIHENPEIYKFLVSKGMALPCPYQGICIIIKVKK